MTKAEPVYQVGEALTLGGIQASMIMVRMFHEKLDIAFHQPMAEVPRSARLDTYLADIGQSMHMASASLQAMLIAEPDDKRLLRAHLIAEEAAEFVKALAERNEVLALDALADLLYVLLGSAVTLDLPLATAFREVHRSNMTKEKQPDDVAKDRVRSKGPNYKPANIAGVLAAHRKS